MIFFARLLLLLSCLAALLSPPAQAARAPAAAAAPCVHDEPVDHLDHEHAGRATQDQNVCDDCGACAGHCMPVLLGSSAQLPADCSDVRVSTPGLRLTGITAAPELKPPRL